MEQSWSSKHSSSNLKTATERSLCASYLDVLSYSTLQVTMSNGWMFGLVQHTLSSA
jgi:hypothetical protein